MITSLCRQVYTFHLCPEVWLHSWDWVHSTFHLQMFGITYMHELWLFQPMGISVKSKWFPSDKIPRKLEKQTTLFLSFLLYSVVLICFVLFQERKLNQRVAIQFMHCWNSCNYLASVTCIQELQVWATTPVWQFHLIHFYQ